MFQTPSAHSPRAGLKRSHVPQSLNEQIRSRHGDYQQPVLDRQLPTCPGQHRELPPHRGHPTDVHDEGLGGLHELLPGRKSGKAFYQFRPK